MMVKAYHFNNGYIQMDDTIPKKRHIGTLLSILLFSIMFFVIMHLTEYAFEISLNTKDNYNIISFGAVFCTIGSSIISITALASNYYYDEFSKSKDTLFTLVNNENVPYIWNFISNKILLNNAKKTIVYNTHFPEVVFEFGTHNLNISIPSNKKDIGYDIIKKNIIMFFSEKLYYNNLAQNYPSLEEAGIYVWECSKYLLKNALLYKIFVILTTCGAMFFVSGIISIFTHI